MANIENDRNETGSPAAIGISYRAGYFPVPLRNVPAESLVGLKVYLQSDHSYCLYRSVDLPFTEKDCQRLLAGGVEYVYVSIKDHLAYYQTIEKCINRIISDRNIQIQKKAEMLYSTSLELAHELLHEPLKKEHVERTGDMAMATVKMIFDDPFAFRHLFEISNHDFYTATHAVNVCTTTIALANRIGLTDSLQVQHLGSGALLHDIGKIFIDSGLLNSSRPIVPEEYAILQKHVELGLKHLQKVAPDLPLEILQVISEHHERIDGSGYPGRLKGDQISLLGQLAGIVDIFDAMSSARPYRDFIYSIEEVMQYLEEQAPEKFDIQLVRSFNKMIENTIKGVGITSDTPSPSKAVLRLPEPDAVTCPEGLDRRFRIPMMISKIKRCQERLLLEEPQRMIVHNMTSAGLSFLSPRPFDLDQNICVSLGNPSQESRYNFFAVVIRCYDYGNGWYTVTTQFHKSQPAKTIEKIKQMIAREKQPAR